MRLRAIGFVAACLAVAAMAPPVVAADGRAAASKSQRERDHEAYRLAGEARRLVEAKKPAEAVPLLEQAAALDPTPNSYAIHVNLGNVRAQLGEPDKAVDEYRIGLRFRPNDGPAMLYMAMAYQDAGKIPAAITWYEKALKASLPAASRERVTMALKLLKKSGGDLVQGDAAAPDYFAVVAEHPLSRWADSSLPIKVYIGPGGSVSGFRESYRQAFRDAMAAWMAASGGRLSWQEVEGKEGATLEVSWTSDPSLVAVNAGSMESGRTVVTTTKGASPTIKEASVTMCTVPLDGSRDPLSDESMMRTCLHEIGHALGLRGHSPNHRDVMFFMRTNACPLAPSARDTATLLKLYGDDPATTRPPEAAGPPN